MLRFSFFGLCFAFAVPFGIEALGFCLLVTEASALQCLIDCFSRLMCVYGWFAIGALVIWLIQLSRRFLAFAQWRLSVVANVELSSKLRPSDIAGWLHDDEAHATAVRLRLELLNAERLDGWYLEFAASL